MSVEVSIKLPRTLRGFAEGAECVKVTAEPPTLGAAVVALCEQHPDLESRMIDPETREIRRFLNLALDVGVVGDAAWPFARDLDGLNTQLNEGQKIEIVTAVAGGAE